jgi:hypothetical protein
MKLTQDKKTITYGFDFLQITVELDSDNRKLYKDKKLEYFTVYKININADNKEEIHSYFEKQYMDMVEFSTYSECLKALILDFLKIPESYEIKRYNALVGGTKTSIRLETARGDVWILQDLLMQYGDTYKDGMYTIFKNVKEYYNRDENKERMPSPFLNPFLKEL